jgi:hypothetical protein
LPVTVQDNWLACPAVMVEGLSEKEAMAGAEPEPAMATLNVTIWAMLSEDWLKVQAAEIAPAALCTSSAEASSLSPAGTAARNLYPLPAEKVAEPAAPSFIAAVKIYSPAAEVVTGPTEIDVPLPALFTAV